MSSRGKRAPVRVSRTYMDDPTSCVRALKLLLTSGAGEGVDGKEKAACTSGGEDDAKGIQSVRANKYQYTR